jgi:predicted RNA-binding Zn-ribbon protein involved in translation (DUF1610 family)
MSKNTLYDNLSLDTPYGIVFECRCKNVIAGTPSDTLMFEMYMNTGMSNLKHEIFISNAAFDPARNLVNKDCPDCGINFLTMIMPGEEMITIYTCTCGYKSTYAEYHAK